MQDNGKKNPVDPRKHPAPGYDEPKPSTKKDIDPPLKKDIDKHHEEKNSG